MVRRTTDRGRLQSIRFGPSGVDLKFKEADMDVLARKFVAHLGRRRVKYAIVSGYPAILLGRSRESEDVDILVAPMSFGSFSALHAGLLRQFYCITPGSAKSMYRDYLDAGRESTSIRYCFSDSWNPNIEFKFARTSLHKLSVAKRIRVRANGHILYIGPLEIQIAYKLWLGSQKDLEDARWIYRIAREHLEEANIWAAARKLKLDEEEARWALLVD